MKTIIAAFAALALLAGPVLADEVCETTLSEVRATSVEKGLNVVEYTGDRAAALKTAIDAEFPGAPFDWEDITMVYLVQFPETGTVNVGFFTGDCLTNYLSNVPMLRWVAILTEAGVR